MSADSRFSEWLFTPDHTKAPSDVNISIRRDFLDNTGGEL